MSEWVDWTIDPETHRANSSVEFHHLAGHVDRVIRESAHDLIGGRSLAVAELIMAQLVHRHGVMLHPEGGLAQWTVNDVPEEYWRESLPAQRAAFNAREEAQGKRWWKCMTCGYPTATGQYSCVACHG